MQLSRDNGHLYPKARLLSQAIRQDTYVDDVDENSEAMGLQREFRTEKWASNDPALLDQIPEVARLEQIVFEKTEIVKTLGLGWDQREDYFVYTIPDPGTTWNEPVNDLIKIIWQRFKAKGSIPIPEHFIFPFIITLHNSTSLKYPEGWVPVDEIRFKFIDFVTPQEMRMLR
ncbi:hypothetical protein LAZ67_2005385 [Cordylochernes scorpioides]|uniref:Uncharacterized protein n=1 Tax=Cordylochernes scorpioides TaxID=51811 RepID=A0ABY6K4C6_9ARAC|nr:hypothetical protein LAZ67_2005385 [Cordylochernes scorpioides]